MEENKTNGREEIYSAKVKAGKRTYFFDIRATKGNDYYLTVTESKRKYNDDGTFLYQKHKLFLYKEDFEKFSGALSDAIKKVIELRKGESEDMMGRIENNFTDVDFDDLDSDSNQPAG